MGAKPGVIPHNKGKLLDHPDAHILSGVVLTPVQSRLVRILSDGLPHCRADLMACIGDDFIAYGPDKYKAWHNVANHISDLRKKLRTIGHDVVCVIVNRQYRYQHIIRLNGTS